MKVVLGHQSNLLEWFSLADFRDLRIAFALVQDKVALVGPLGQREFLQELSVHASPQTVDLVQSFIREHPKAILQDIPSYEDQFLSEEFDGNLSDLALSPRFNAAKELHLRDVEAGESRDAAWSRLLGHLIPLTAEIEVTDRFFGRSVLDEEDVVQFWLKALGEGEPRTIRIRTEIPTDLRFGSSFAARKERFRAKLERACLNLGNPIELRVQLFTSMPHDRWLSLKMKGTKDLVATSLPEGVRTFADEIAPEPRVVKAATRKAVESLNISQKWIPRPEKLKKDSETTTSGGSLIFVYI